MSEEIKQILRKVQRQECWTDEALEEILSWHIRERKKWALGLLLEIQGAGFEDKWAEGAKFVIAEIRKRIEEG